MKIVRKIYYDKATGAILADTFEREGPLVRATTVTQDIATYKVLDQRVRSTFDYIELTHGQYAEEFRTAASYRVNPATKRLEFSTGGQASTPSTPPVYVPPISETVQALSEENAGLLLQNAVQDVSIAELQDENAALMMRLAMLEIGGDANV